VDLNLTKNETNSLILGLNVSFSNQNKTMKKFDKASISIDLALEMAKEAMKKATEIGLKISVSIVDESGVEKAFARMDGAPLISVETARKKAVLAAGFGIATGSSWYNFIKDDPILMHGADQLPGFILLGGGSPIQIDGQLCGAIGISGGHYSQDEICVSAALQLI
jgi:uncharacterized protein GlcG (DUF336 family)